MVVDAETLPIRRFYLPWAGAKRIRQADIRGVERISLTALGDRWRLWGSSMPSYWANLDMRRSHKNAGFVIDLGCRVQPVVTRDDPDTFEKVLRIAIPETAFTSDPRPRYGL